MQYLMHVCCMCSLDPVVRGFLTKFPFSLPCLVNMLLCITAAVSVAVFMPETLGANKWVEKCIQCTVMYIVHGGVLCMYTYMYMCIQLSYMYCIYMYTCMSGPTVTVHVHVHMYMYMHGNTCA